MNRWMLAGASALALAAVSPQAAHSQAAPSGSAQQCQCPGQSAEGATDRERRMEQIRRRAESDDLSFRELSEIIRPPDVADDEDGEDRAGDDVTTGTAGQPGARGNSLVTEGEVVPDGIREVQDDEAWDGDFDEDARDSARGESADDGNGMRDRMARQDRNDRASREGWSRGEGRRFDRGELRPDRRAREDNGDEASEAREQRREMHREAMGNRRDRIAGIALLAARNAYPEADFRRYRFAIDDGQRVVQIVGTLPGDERRIQVDVRPNGRINSISERIPLDRVPESVRSVVRGELGRFRVAHVSRTIDRDLDLEYRFSGFAASGRAATVEIGADGSGLSVEFGEPGRSVN